MASAAVAKLQEGLHAVGIDICQSFDVRLSSFISGVPYNTAAFPPEIQRPVHSALSRRPFSSPILEPPAPLYPQLAVIQHCEDPNECLTVLQVAEYNCLAKRHPLNTYSRPRSLGVVIGSTRSFWPHFVKYVRSFEEGKLPAEPIDRFFEQVITNAVTEATNAGAIKHDIIFDWHLPKSGKFAHIQTAGHVAGVAFYDREVFWSCHEKYGLWFSYRAVVIFDLDFEGPAPHPPKSVLTEETIAAIKVLTAKAELEQWQNRQTRLDIRDCCLVGKGEYRYDGDCLAYFFPIHETTSAVLERIRQVELPTQPLSVE